MAHQDTGKWHHLYNTAHWKRRRKLQLAQHPLCAICLQRGLPTAATVADHVKPHNGDRSPYAKAVTTQKRNGSRYEAMAATWTRTAGQLTQGTQATRQMRLDVARNTN